MQNNARLNLYYYFLLHYDTILLLYCVYVNVYVCVLHMTIHAVKQRHFIVCYIISLNTSNILIQYDNCNCRVIVSDINRRFELWSLKSRE